MDVPPHREIACAILIDLEGRFLLQRRDDVPNILYPVDYSAGIGRAAIVD